MIRQFFWYKVGNGISISAWFDNWCLHSLSISAWFDNWCLHSPLISSLSARQVNRGGFNMNSRLVDIIANGEWVWPDQWNSKFPNAIVPSIDVYTPDKLWWRDRNGIFNELSFGVAWNDIRPREAKVVWASVVWFANCIPRHAFILWG
ncbi:RNA-directed DNA polymerase, eukaryota, Reverse transcriptase zinc-binding domain protein [Artemisia annua]|uniref:RNA-directed DNA polymerase, eukaryota, Reverse transcriptase zinc-binding domain protein n=1 Tax=Artemisia annua TaxID=35608 RepID=A0A2U1LZ95_ARTAN|nr:RNA-directed DNA polymerase, eukaryota, Reverse transcriptase zinc-binding domain protein [Artemisia annua]